MKKRSKVANLVEEEVFIFVFFFAFVLECYSGSLFVSAESVVIVLFSAMIHS